MRLVSTKALWDTIQRKEGKWGKWSEKTGWIQILKAGWFSCMRRVGMSLDYCLELFWI